MQSAGNDSPIATVTSKLNLRYLRNLRITDCQPLLIIHIGFDHVLDQSGDVGKHIKASDGLDLID